MGKAKFLNRIAVRQDDKLVLVHLREVFWVQSKGNLLSLHLRDADYDCRMTMKDLMAMLDPGCFLRIHRNAIVNLDYVVEFDLPRNGNAFVVLRNGKALPISKSGKTELKRSLSPRSFFQSEATEAV
jgi:two-component system LytT family response regulator